MLSGARRHDDDAVVLDDLRTWPQPLAALLDRHLSVMKQYAEFNEHRYDGLRHGVSQRELQAMHNPFSDARAALHRDVKRILENAIVVAYHCTRLTVDELEGVQREGLRRLDRTAMHQKIANRAHAGDLSREQAAKLLQRLETRVEEGVRRGTLWAVLSEVALMDEDGLSQPLRYWGGEVVLCRSDGDAEHLRTIGTACIVEFCAPVSSAVLIDLAERFLDRFLYLARGHGDDGSSDACFDAGIPPQNIRRIITRGDAEFEHLTRCNAWRDPLT